MSVREAGLFYRVFAYKTPVQLLTVKTSQCMLLGGQHSSLGYVMLDRGSDRCKRPQTQAFLNTVLSNPFGSTRTDVYTNEAEIISNTRVFHHL